MDPVGGSGFAPPGAAGAPAGAAVTQHYTTAGFGGLKTGVGLLADFGRPVEVRQVRLRAVSPGVTLDVRAGDAPPTGRDPLAVVAPDRLASGAAALAVGRPASHRYWLVWVASLSPDGAGTYWAALAGVTFLG